MIQPLRNYIAVREQELPEKLSMLIALPDQTKEPIACGQIVAAGKGKLLPDGRVRPMPVELGDCVLFSKRSAREAYIDGQDYLMIRDDDILGVLAS